MGVAKYPTLMFGDPEDLEKYEGEMFYEELLQFAQANLGPKCSPQVQDLCTVEEREQMSSIMEMSDEDLELGIQDSEQQIADTKDQFDGEANVLQVEYDKLQDAVQKL